MRPKQIKELVRIVEDSNIGELEVTKWWGNKVRICKTSTNNIQMVPQQPITAPAPVSTEPTDVSQTEAVPTESAAEVFHAPSATNNLVEIKSPMVGTFYRAPSPDAAPYVEIGDAISPGKVLCIIEAMKLMNEIEAEVTGKIIEILVENAQPVEYNQVLFRVQKS
jgi:acetyl-CoA carboxylase biotin carboxyl carrier protein